VKVLVPSVLVRIAGEAAADFRATIQESVVTRRIDGVILVSADLSPHLALKSPPPPGSITIQGAQLVVDGVRPDQVRLMMDCAGIHRAGQFAVRAHPEALPNVSVLEWTPKELTLDVGASGQ
jgi:hypothetical protein